MSAFVADLEARLSARLGELDDERGRIEMALSHLAPNQLVRKHKQHVPRGVNRDRILDALRQGSGMRLPELRAETGIASNTLSSTLHAMKCARQVTRRSNGIWKARR
jgi:hypothetical protein